MLNLEKTLLILFLSAIDSKYHASFPIKLLFLYFCLIFCASYFFSSNIFKNRSILKMGVKHIQKPGVFSLKRPCWPKHLRLSWSHWLLRRVCWLTEAWELVKVSHCRTGNLSFVHIMGVVIPVRKVTKTARVVVKLSPFHLEVARKMTLRTRTILLQSYATLSVNKLST